MSSSSLITAEPQHPQLPYCCFWANSVQPHSTPSHARTICINKKKNKGQTSWKGTEKKTRKVVFQPDTMNAVVEELEDSRSRWQITDQMQGLSEWDDCPGVAHTSLHQNAVPSSLWWLCCTLFLSVWWHPYMTERRKKRKEAKDWQM